MKTACIYKRYNKGYLIFGLSKTDSGFRIASEPFIQIPENEGSVEIIANAIKASLCNDDDKRIQDPQNWKEFDKNFLQRTNLNSIKELYKPTVKYVSIEADEGKIIFTPSRPAEKPDQGFVNKCKDESVTVPFKASNQNIVVAYKIALSNCQ